MKYSSKVAMDYAIASSTSTSGDSWMAIAQRIAEYCQLEAVSADSWNRSEATTKGLRRKKESIKAIEKNILALHAYVKVPRSRDELVEVGRMYRGWANRLKQMKRQAAEIEDYLMANTLYDAINGDLTNDK